MKKELCALGVILALIAGAAANVCHVTSLSRYITAQLTAAQSCCRRGDFDGAEQALQDGLDRWLADDGYTHIFIRHSEIDSTSDAFYDALDAIVQSDADSAVVACEKLQYHIDSIAAMESVTFKSVF